MVKESGYFDIEGTDGWLIRIIDKIMGFIYKLSASSLLNIFIILATVAYRDK
jgi:hypothetical protein